MLSGRVTRVSDTGHQGRMPYPQCHGRKVTFQTDKWYRIELSTTAKPSSNTDDRQRDILVCASIPSLVQHTNRRRLSA